MSVERSMGLEDPSHRRLRRDATGHPILTIGTSWESTHFSESRWRGSMESYPIDSNLSSPPSPVPAFRATCHPKSGGTDGHCRGGPNAIGRLMALGRIVCTQILKV